jgi:hypothetical protein
MHPGHRQGDVLLGDGSRMLTCTKHLRRGARTAMLQLPGLMRVDVVAHDDAYAIRLRKLCDQRLVGGLSTMTRRESATLDGGEQRVSAFHVEPSEGDVRRVDVLVTLPANAVGDEVPCTAVAFVRPR